MKLAIFLTSTFSCLLAVDAFPLFNRATDPNTVLSVLAQQPDLSIWSGFIQKSGGDNPNPAFEERFNSPLDTRNYTVFAPTNAAMSKIPKATLDLLARSQSYELLESLVRLHITEGMFTALDLTSANAQSPMTAIEGFPLAVSVTPATEAGQQPKYKLNDVGLTLTDIPASNGRIHTLDAMLNPYSNYFGVSNSSAKPAGGSPPQGPNTTMLDVVESDPRLSTLHTQIGNVDPEFLSRLSLSKPENERQIFLAASNDAFQNVAVNSMSAPSNVGLSRYLLRFGMLTGDLSALNMMVEGQVQSVSGFNVTVKKRGEAWVVGNAAVVERDICTGNGCVWIIDKVLDPLSGAL
ncbi:hypothetical protein ONS95_000199 [Cadophora gregata]|uniref:uncharacterized protein n=1 Tax=Cadophora gregata TaxID=51156 RepID=UPI0026DC35FA|nr:uncharacterized protein ONS95_000199 [Cadophora gregata]KAK0115523.1 hypothetical protein ONS96_013976 [Cadophora gregata f. sp. sojae]KAK0128221.1 hypothetical protein ONS95_000199 [Cadophora gregata]